jgi:cephalosporin-C deacetylase
MPQFVHGFPFDPAHGYSLEALRGIEPPAAPPDFRAFWEARYQGARQRLAAAELGPPRAGPPGWRVRDLSYRSTGDFTIRGWLAEPADSAVVRGLILGHGYGGCEGPELSLAIDGTALVFPCFRGLSRSRRAPISADPAYHVLHDIHDRDRYILGGCVEDLWLAVSALLEVHPQVRGRVGYAGISFGGGIGALALPWEERVARGALTVPTFGHHPLRLTLPSVGSAESVRRLAREHGNITATLPYYDAAVAAQHIQIPMLVAAACFDPAVPPPGQFAVYNALPGPRELIVLEAGHWDWPGRAAQDAALATAQRAFFERL